MTSEAITSSGVMFHTPATPPMAAWKPSSDSWPSCSMTSAAFSPYSPTSKRK
jgi:hypothetical protein